jgi:aspartate-semialdehyde dehydrogenase
LIIHQLGEWILREINASELTANDKIIANPNCSTIQMVLALAPLHRKYNIKRIIVSTYQSITGTGVKAVQQFENECAGIDGDMVYKYKINRNCIPQCDSFEDNGYTKEEMKLVNETKKILSDNSIAVTATAVRVPVVGGHSEALNVEFTNDFDVNDVRTILSQTDGVVVQDNLDTFTYPMPRYAEGKNEVFVGRIRRDESQPNTINMWVVADNLRKGAATNTIQIAEYLIAAKLV